MIDMTEFDLAVSALEAEAKMLPDTIMSLDEASKIMADASRDLGEWIWKMK